MTKVVRLALVAAAVGLAAAAAPSACLYPSYTFDAPEPTGAGGAGGVTTVTTGGGHAGGSGGRGGGATVTSQTATTTSSTSTAGGGGAGGGGTESCLNGIDDNGDGKVDCADPQCAADYECVDVPPVGWGNFGIVALSAGAPGSEPACTTDDPTKAYAGNDALVNDPAICTQCGCDPPIAQSCVAFDLDPNTNGIQAAQVANVPCAIKQATALSTVTVPDICGNVCFQGGAVLPGMTTCGMPPTACDQSVRSSTPSVSGGMCAATGGKATLNPAQWSISAKACKGAPLGKGCQNGQVCQPKPPMPFQQHVCVGKSGDLQCPLGSYQTKHTFFGGTEDDRTCTTCTCGNPTGGACQITMSLYSDAGCNTQVASFQSGMCFDLANNPAVASSRCSVTVAPHGSTCAPSPGGGVPTGALKPSQPTTFCCAN